MQAVRITWPDAERSQTTYTGLLSRERYRIVQSEEPVRLERPTVPFRRAPGGAMHPAAHEGP